MVETFLVGILGAGKISQDSQDPSYIPIKCPYCGYFRGLKEKGIVRCHMCGEIINQK